MMYVFLHPTLDFVSQAIASLCSKFPRKHGVMINFLSSMLREEGGYEYKKAIGKSHSVHVLRLIMILIG